MMKELEAFKARSMQKWSEAMKETRGLSGHADWWRELVAEMRANKANEQSEAEVH